MTKCIYFFTLIRLDASLISTGTPWDAWLDHLPLHHRPDQRRGKRALRTKVSVVKQFANRRQPTISLSSHSGLSIHTHDILCSTRSHERPTTFVPAR